MFKLKHNGKLVNNELTGKVAEFKTQQKARTYVENREWKGKLVLILPDGTEQAIQE